MSVEPIPALIPVPWLFILLSLTVFHKKNLFLYCTMSFDCYENIFCNGFFSNILLIDKLECFRCRKLSKTTTFPN